MIFQFEEVIIRPQAGHGSQSEKTGFRIIRVTFDQGGMTARYKQAAGRVHDDNPQNVTNHTDHSIVLLGETRLQDI